uniref:Uncharacterized protein n=1 Tax=Anguilla anguilla TaxID=7936 RepID=A0A0E9S9P4_ANGAN
MSRTAVTHLGIKPIALNLQAQFPKHCATPLASYQADDLAKVHNITVIQHSKRTTIF